MVPVFRVGGRGAYDGSFDMMMLRRGEHAAHTMADRDPGALDLGRS
jgi:hypothetical protein